MPLVLTLLAVCDFTGLFERYFAETYPTFPSYSTGIHLQSQSSSIVTGVPRGITVITREDVFGAYLKFRLVVTYLDFVNAKMFGQNKDSNKAITGISFFINYSFRSTQLIFLYKCLTSTIVIMLQNFSHFNKNFFESFKEGGTFTDFYPFYLLIISGLRCVYSLLKIPFQRYTSLEGGARFAIF